ncbi:hypothetical protein SAMN04489798_4265 [Pseudomonas arsenicoxydans]|uniref:Uncharacterized protein n=1 Tax=Pseudomonas arsenicoxydans TaxID=702115 RepID=A0A1H0NP13_9PSED|nr:hypothetical protein SAMN04489798_4265 [Pseudomonas arsenicoxydans]
MTEGGCFQASAIGGWGWFWVHIRCCGNGGLGFRPDGGSLWKSPKVTKGLLPLTFGASPRLGMPSFRSCSVGPPPSAIHGRGRLPRHPCRGAHCAEPPLGLSRGRAPPKPKRGGLPADLALQRLRVVIVLQSVGAVTRGGLPANLALADVLNTCGSELARDGGITGNITAD